MCTRTKKNVSGACWSFGTVPGTKMNTRSGVIRVPTGWPSLYEVRRTVKTIPMTENCLVSTIFSIYQQYISDIQTTTIKEARFGLLKIPETILNYPIYHNTVPIQFILNDCILTLSKEDKRPEKYINYLKQFSNRYRLNSKKTYIKAILDRSILGSDITSHIIKFVV